MEKFPVTSTKGYKYLARVSEYVDWEGDAGVKVTLYKVTEVETFLFRKLKRKESEIHTSYFDEYTKEYLDYVKAVKKTVMKYEESNSFAKWESEEFNTKKFQEWNGDCK